MAQPGIDPNIQKAQTYLREMGFHARVRDDAGVLKRTPIEVTGVDDSLTRRSLRRFRAENDLPPDADLQTTIARMEQEDVKNKYRQSLERQGLQYPYTGQAVAASTPAAPAAAAATPAATTPAAPAATAPADMAAKKTEAASYLMMMGYDVTEGETRTVVSDAKLLQATESFRQANQIPQRISAEEMISHLRAGVAADPMSVEIMMGVSNSETPTALEAGALQYGLQAHGFNVPVTGQEDAATRAAMTQLVDSHQAQLDSGAIVQTPTGYAKPGQPQAAAAPEATVEQAQAYLKILGYNNVGPVDNIQGPLTNGALTQFARDNQLAEDASLNDLTAAMKAKVISDPTVMARVETIVNADNPSRSEALAAQYAINAVYGTLPNGAQLDTDGIVGPRTEGALNHIKANPTVFAQDAAAPVAAATPTAPVITPADGVAAPVVPVEVAPLPPVATVTAPDSAAPVSAAATAAPATGAAAATIDAAANRHAGPVAAPDRYEIGRGGTLSPYQRDVAGMRGGPDFDAARPPPLEDLRAERQREAEQRRENAENNRAIQQGTRGLEQLTNARGTDDIRGISSIAQAVLGLSR